MSANAQRRLRLFALALFVAGAASVWVILGTVLRDWLGGRPIQPPFSVVWAICLIGGLSAVAGAIVFVRLSVTSLDPKQHPVTTEKRMCDGNVRYWCTWLHASALGGYVCPFAHIALPVIIWLAKRRLHPLVDVNGRAVFNFQISTTLFALVGLLLSVLVIGLALVMAVAVLHLSMTVVAARRAARGEVPGYPFTLDVFR